MTKAAIALAAIALAERQGCHLLDALAICAEKAGIRPYSNAFDGAASLAGLPYCRSLDLYVDPETKRKAELLGFAHAHKALLC